MTELAVRKKLVDALCCKLSRLKPWRWERKRLDSVLGSGATGDYAWDALAVERRIEGLTYRLNTIRYSSPRFAEEYADISDEATGFLR